MDQVSAKGQPEKKMPGFLEPRTFGLDEETNNKKEQNKANGSVLDYTIN